MSESLLNTYFQFLRTPVLNSPPEVISRKKARNRILRLYSLHLPLVLIIGIVIGQLLRENNANKLTDIFENTPVGILLFTIVVFVPIVEESLFRLPLRSFAVNLALSSSLAIWSIIPWFTGFAQDLVISLGWSLSALTLYLGIARSKMTIFPQFYEQYSRIIFYLTTLLFGIIHIGNYQSSVWSLLPLLILPQIIIGLWLGFVRLRYGFWWGVFAHGFHNGCVSLPMVIFQLLGSDELSSQELEIIPIENLSFVNLLAIGAVVFYVLGGLTLCIIVAWKMVGEWVQSR